MYIYIYIYTIIYLPQRLEIFKTRELAKDRVAVISTSVFYHRLPDGVRTNGVFAEVPQYTIIMTLLWHNYGIIMRIYGTSIKENVCPDPVWKPVILFRRVVCLKAEDGRDRRDI